VSTRRVVRTSALLAAPPALVSEHQEPLVGSQCVERVHICHRRQFDRGRDNALAVLSELRDRILATGSRNAGFVGIVCITPAVTVIPEVVDGSRRVGYRMQPYIQERLGTAGCGGRWRCVRKPIDGGEQRGTVGAQRPSGHLPVVIRVGVLSCCYREPRQLCPGRGAAVLVFDLQVGRERQVAFAGTRRTSAHGDSDCGRQNN